MNSSTTKFLTGTDIALDAQDALLHDLIANKVSRGYSLEFVTLSGKSYFGFPVGLDRDMVQILVTPDFGQDRGNIRHQVNNYDLNGTNYFIWLPIVNIEAIIENRLAVKHFRGESQKEISRHQRALIRSCDSYLDAKELTTKTEE